MRKTMARVNERLAYIADKRGKYRTYKAVFLTDEGEAWLRERYADTPNKILAEEIGICVRTLNRMASERGERLPPSWSSGRLLTRP